MSITRPSFGLITQFLDLGSDASTEIPGSPSQTSWDTLLAPVGALGVGAIAEEVELGDDDTVARFLELQEAAARHGLELFLRLRELADEGLWSLRERAMDAAEKLAPGQMGPPDLQLLADLGQPTEEELERWLPRQGSASPDPPTEGPRGWGQPLAFSLFAPDAETALRRLEMMADLLLEAGGRPGVELPVWLAGYAVGGAGAEGSAAGVVQIGAHALALGIERVFLGPGPEGGWWPADLRSPPPPLQAFRTLAAQLGGAGGITCQAAGQYRFERADERASYLLWSSGGAGRLPAGLRGPLLVTTTLGESRETEAGQLRLTDEPVFVVPLG